MMLALFLMLMPPTACQPIQSNWIRGRDLAAAVPSFRGIAEDAQIALAPLPGQQRVFQIGDLKRIALVHHLSADPAKPVCFGWQLAIPTRAALEAAMRLSLQGRRAQLAVVDSSQTPAPPGEIAFPLTGLSAGSENASLWRGYIRYAEGRRYPIWARVIVSVEESHVVAAADLRPGDPLDAAALKLERYAGPVPREKFLTDPSSAIGCILRCPLAAGTPLQASMLDTPHDVNRGDLVNAIVQTGAARLEVQGIAENDGRKGQIITIRNTRSGRCFHGRVMAKGTVQVVPGGPVGLAVEARGS